MTLVARAAEGHLRAEADEAGAMRRRADRAGYERGRAAGRRRLRDQARVERCPPIVPVSENVPGRASSAALGVIDALTVPVSRLSFSVRVAAEVLCVFEIETNRPGLHHLDARTEARCPADTV